MFCGLHIGKTPIMSLNLSDLTKRLFRRFTKKTTPARNANRFRPMLETCEDRTVPTAVLTIETTAHATEGGDDGRILIHRDDATGYLAGTFSLSGTAASGDHDVTDLAFHFDPTVSSFYLDIEAANDSASELTETLILTLNTGSGYTISGTAGSATVDIRDNDAQYVSVVKIADAVEGVSDGTFRFTRTGDLSGSLSASYNVGGAATSGTDFTALGGSFEFMMFMPTFDVTVATLGDSTSEPTETVVLTVTSGTGYGVGTGGSATVNIFDNDAQVVTVATLSNPMEGSTGSLVFTRTGDLSSSLTADYTVGGSATSGTDYTSLGSTPTVTFLASAATAIVSVLTTGDSTSEPTETVAVTLSTGTGYTVGTASGATVNIFDNDTPVVAVTATDTFEGSATGGFTFTRVGDLSSSLTVDYTTSGTATSVTDYTVLSGSVTFAAGVDRMEVFVEALGDNTADDGETVIATIDEDYDYDIDEEGDAATVTIADQPLTISVTRLTDGEEGVSNGSFRFLRSGDISSSLIVTYTITGTAVGGTDYTALSGSVTFAADDADTDVTVTVTNDSTVEDTETVTVTLDEDDDYLLGNDSDTVFITDNDTRRVYWISTGSTDWLIPENWSINAVPISTDDVYFSGGDSPYYSNVDCANLGYGPYATNLAFKSIHFVNEYSGTVTLAVPLTVGTYEQTTGMLDQPDNEEDENTDLSVTKAMLWSGGTLNSLDSGASVNIDGAVGFIDPPDSTSLSIATASTLRVIDDAVVTFLPGIIDFIGGNGLYIATAKVEVYTKDNVDVTLTKPSSSDAAVEVAWDATLKFDSIDKARIGTCVSSLPISNAGTMFILPTVHLEVKGHAGGGTGPSLLQTNGVMNWWTGSNIVTEHGMNLYSGTLQFNANAPNIGAIILGNLTVGSGTTAPTIKFNGAKYGRFDVQGEVNWVSGTFISRLDGTTNGPQRSADVWRATEIFVRGGAATKVNPVIQPDETLIAQHHNWVVLMAEKGFQGPVIDDPTEYGGNYGLAIQPLAKGRESIIVYRK